MLGRVLKDCNWREEYFFLPVLEAGGEVLVRWELVPSAAVTGSLAQAPLPASRSRWGLWIPGFVAASPARPPLSSHCVLSLHTAASPMCICAPLLIRTPVLLDSAHHADRMWSTGEGNGKPLQYSRLENPMNRMKRQNDRLLSWEGLGAGGEGGDRG